MYFIFLKRYRIVKIKDNELDFIYFLNNFIIRKGVVGVMQGRLSLLRVRCTMSNAARSYCTSCGTNCDFSQLRELRLTRFVSRHYRYNLDRKEDMTKLFVIGNRWCSP
jgi:hypothetical protein